MANLEHIETLSKGVHFWNAWRTSTHERPDFSGAVLPRSTLPGIDLRFADLSGAVFSWSDLSGSDLRNANLYQTELYRADLRHSNLEGATLAGAKLHDTNLAHARLCGADLFRVDFIHTDLTGADFSGARCSLTTFGGVNLSETIGLDATIHEGPSNIDVSTLLHSLKSSPSVFFTGAGVPEPFLAHVHQFLPTATEFYSCFISYSTRDHEFVEPLHAGLLAKGLRVWYAPEDLKIGERFQERIQQEIVVYDKVMIVLSEASTRSPWVEREVNAAFEREDREKRTILFPIRIDGAVMESNAPWASDIRRTRHIGDFSNWKDAAQLRRSFDRLLRDLQASRR